MNGEELREALRREMATITPPPPLSTAATLRAARRALVRRRSAWACAGSAAMVLAVAGGVAATGALGTGGFSPAGPWLQPAPHPSSDDTARPWPTGPDGLPQEDRTARAGSRYDQGVRLLNAALSVVPVDYTVENPVNQPTDEMPLRSHQAQFEDWVNDIEVWSYMASVALPKGEQMGRLLVEVHTAGNQLPTEPCALALTFWGMEGDCQVESVGAAQVGVVVQPGSDRRFEQWAAYRHPDGVVVFVAQSATFDDVRPALTELPFTVPQLAALATDERFHLQ